MEIGLIDDFINKRTEELKMFDDIGKKIKQIAVVAAYLIIVVSAIMGLKIIADSDFELLGMLLGVVVIVAGVVCAFLSNCLLYGYGQLIENSQIIADKLSGKTTSRLLGDDVSSDVHRRDRDDGGTPPPRDTPIKNGWKCAACGKMNESYTGTCSCGKSRYN